MYIWQNSMYLHLTTQQTVSFVAHIMYGLHIYISWIVNNESEKPVIRFIYEESLWKVIALVNIGIH
jgi:hypothetical protein